MRPPQKSTGQIVRERHRQEDREELVQEMMETLAVLDSHSKHRDCDPCKVLRPAYLQGQLNAASNRGTDLPPRKVPATAGV